MSVEGVNKSIVLLYPAFGTREELAEQYHRVLWYLPETSAYEVYLFHRHDLNVDRPAILGERPSHLAEQSGAGTNIKIELWSPGRFMALAARAATVGVWKVGQAKLLDRSSVLSRRKFVVLDPRAKGTWELARYSSILFDHMSARERKELRERSRGVLACAADALRGLGKAYVFGTGPSLASAKEFAYGDGVRIVCNSIVRNAELLDHIEPHFIAASDFVYHFGPSRYADQFRRDLVAAIERTGAYFLVPEQLAPLMLQHYPQIAGRTIAIPLTNRFDLRERSSPVNVQLLERFKVRTLDSVLNLLMLPVASTLADEVYVLGCDGRKPPDTAFWSHHSASQYTDLLRTVNDTHPGFFDVDYVDYYDRYCSHVAAVIAAGEALGKRYASLVPSYVPALAERQAAGQVAR